MGFQSDWTDPTSSQVWMGARFYKPAPAMFTSRDTYDGVLSSPLSLNRYTYAEGDPIQNADPTGRTAEQVYPGYSYDSLTPEQQDAANGFLLMATIAKIQGAQHGWSNERVFWTAVGAVAIYVALWRADYASRGTPAPSSPTVRAGQPKGAPKANPLPRSQPRPVEKRISKRFTSQGRFDSKTADLYPIVGYSLRVTVWLLDLAGFVDVIVNRRRESDFLVAGRASRTFVFPSTSSLLQVSVVPNHEGADVERKLVIFAELRWIEQVPTECDGPCCVRPPPQLFGR